jgi:PAS domain S-box-containing protein/putative nucleotidyltransferase with HDIG domain
MGRPKVMIVEDEAIVALDIKNRLQGLGYEPAGTARSGREALELAREIGPDVILMDIMLEGDMDGIDAARAINAEMSAPVIYLTAYADQRTLDRAKITQPFGYIIKPFEDRELHLTIEMALYKHQIDRKLVENQRWLSTTLKSIGDAVVSTDQGGKVRFLNPAACELLGANPEESLGRDLDEVVRFKGIDGQSVEEAIASSPEQELAGPSGGVTPISASQAPIVGENGECSGTVLVFRDVTEGKRAEQALRESVQELRRTLQETVNALTLMSEKRDPYTAGHQQRVAELACAIAETMGLEEEKVLCLRMAGILHDIGKIYIPAEILAKPARLNKLEYSIIKSHPEVGRDILKSISFPWPVADIVLQHHERLDGSGYPQGLSGDEILEEARILAVADVVEAMSSHRPYRASLGLQAALDEVQSQEGAQYDGNVVRACIHLFEDKGFQFQS